MLVIGPRPALPCIRGRKRARVPYALHRQHGRPATVTSKNTTKSRHPVPEGRRGTCVLRQGNTAAHVCLSNEPLLGSDQPYSSDRLLFSKVVREMKEQHGGSSVCAVGMDPGVEQ